MANTTEQLASWVSLNDALMNGDLESANALLEAETKGKARRKFLLRIHSRINKLRAIAEREKILSGFID